MKWQNSYTFLHLARIKRMLITHHINYRYLFLYILSLYCLGTFYFKLHFISLKLTFSINQICDIRCQKSAAV